MTEEYDGAEEVGTPVPPALLALLAGLAVLVGFTLVAPYLLPPVSLTVLLGIGAALGALCWVIGAAVAMRNAGPVWIFGSLIVLLAAGALAGFGVSRLLNAGSTRDASTFAEMELGPDGKPVLPRGADTRGPISKRYVTAFNEATADRRDYENAVGAMQLGTLSSPYLLQQAPQVLEHCGEIGTLKEKVAGNADRQAKRTAELAQTVRASNLPDKVKDGIILMIAPTSEPGEPDPAITSQNAVLDGTQALCELLAKKSWRNDDARFGFTNAADWARFREIDAQRKAAASDIAALDRKATTRFTEGREMVRDVLSR
ncbi:hypothetical protein [Sphingosinithalassobacter portus]|uniref:hypothetical protein n=1 Tax=Stakelama portus TaxID=2676234 RepID=UPI000D6DE3EB|nr:hypothetical protein [Sphingosinithalassobacter portus]